MRKALLAIPLFFLSLGAWCTPASASSSGLSFEQRVRAQARIERIYFRYRIGSPLRFEEAVPRPALERKVRNYLEQSDALARVWGEPVTGEDLARELERIARDTRRPDRLEEIYRALNHDPVLIQECFARPVLVDRLARRHLAEDPVIQTGPRRDRRDRERAGRMGRLVARGAG